MTDARLRELERAWAETGAPHDGAACLLERVRIGALSQERLNVAAYCGDASAVIAAGVVAPSDEFVEWFRGLAALGDESAARSDAAIARLLLPHCGPAIDDATRALDLLDAWLAEPTPENADRAYEAGQYAGEQVPPHPTQELRQAIWTTCGIAMAPTAVRLGRITWRVEARDTAVRAMQVLPAVVLRRGCEEALLRWALNAAAL